MSTLKPARRSRPLRREDPEHLFFVTTRTLEEVFWLHPLLCSKLEPVNREARRVVAAKRARLRARLERLVVSANRRRPENQPRQTVEEAEKLAEDFVSSARAQAPVRDVLVSSAPRRRPTTALVQRCVALADAGRRGPQPPRASRSDRRRGGTRGRRDLARWRQEDS
jgi:hypothetical protein